MAFGTFDLVIDGERQDGTPETKARLQLTAQGSGTLRDEAGDEFKFPPQFANAGGVAISLPYTITLFTDTAVGEGDSTTIGYEGYVTTGYGRVPFAFAAREAESTVNLVDLTDDVVTPISDLQQFRDETLAAATLAEASAAPQQFAGLRRALADTSRSTAIQVIGDSTGNEITEWPHKVLQAIATENPAWTVEHRIWNNTTQAYDAPISLQTGTAGARYMDCDGTKTFRGAPSVHLPNVIDVRARVSATDWTPTTSRLIVGQMGSTAERSWGLALHTSGALMWVYSTDGSATTNMFGGGPVVADGAATWVRGVFTPNDGAGNRTFKTYQSADGVTWTQVGATTTTAGAVTLFNAATADPYAGFGLGGNLVGVFGRWVGRIYSVDIRDGLDGKPVAPRLPDLWAERFESTGSLTSPPMVGAPILTLVNGSHPGADITYLGDATRLPKMMTDFGQSVILLSDSHNERSYVGKAWLSRFDAWAAQVQALAPGVPIIAMTQNPEKTTANYALTHAQRRRDLIAYGVQQSTRARVFDVAPLFLDNATWQTDWMTDDMHPNATGSTVWANAVKAAYDTTVVA